MRDFWKLDRDTERKKERDAAYEQGYRKGLEDAARVAENPGDDFWPPRGDIAAAIRALGDCANYVVKGGLPPGNTPDIGMQQSMSEEDWKDAYNPGGKSHAMEGE